MLSNIVTWNLLFKGVIGGLITALVAMGIVLVYRSSRVINFAVGNMGVPATALFAIMAGKHGWPYWPALVGALTVGALTGTVIELAVIRRLFRSPRVIVLVATIGVAQLCEAVTLVVARIPNRVAPDAIPASLHGRVASGTRHRGQREPGARAHRRADHHRRPVVAPRSHRVRRRGACVGDERRPRPHDRHQPEARVDRRVDDRRASCRPSRCCSPRATRARPTSSTSAPTRCCAAWPRR